MAIIGMLTREQIRARYARLGWLLFCPVYFAVRGDTLSAEERNGIPEWLLALAIVIQDTMMYMLVILDDDFEPYWMVLDTGPIEGRE